MKYESLAIHGGRKDKADIQGVNYPLYLSSTFVQDKLDDFSEFMYSRSNNPTRNNVEVLSAQLEGAKYGLAMSSGMAATALAFSLLKPGEKVLINSNVYGGTWTYVSKVFDERNIDYEIVTNFNTYDFEQADEKTTTIFIETPSNPLLDVTDIQGVSKKAKEKGMRVIVDNTFMTSYLQKPLELGADIVVYSATKYYAGHSDIIAGLVMVNDDAIYDELKFHQKILGAILSPFDSFLLTRGIKTLPVRMDRHLENTMQVAHYFQDSGAVEKVYYTGLKIHEGYEIQRKQAKGDGAVLSVALKKEYDYAIFCNELKLFDLAVSLGGVESLVCHPASMTHESYAKELQEQIGITENLLRFSVGIENIDDLLMDIQQALKKAKK
ncbi:trans-sulfuration enzyme family protein [Marinisporobacter balticus]|uniref:Cystathionine beta-lyase n=1 Tax=Marinisporobacter balticus TaxID=2018667 RepID=A0A4R2KKU4_9FIRM|nr:PLP-dependent aspartate aminotransferase family protein [Marinisporobacter balticus]TCO70648.1 cystathionine beta-lyase [Marinisporobacter balticus]